MPYLPKTERPRMVRSGILMDTGDSMPNTEFRRSNPLDSDVIMVLDKGRIAEMGTPDELSKAGGL